MSITAELHLENLNLLFFLSSSLIINGYLFSLHLTLASNLLLASILLFYLLPPSLTILVLKRCSNLVRSKIDIKTMGLV